MGGVGGAPVEEADPELFEFALMHLSATAAGRRGDVPVAVAVAEAYVEWAGIDAEPGVDALSDADVRAIVAVTKRMTALGGLRASGLVEMEMNDDEDRRMLIEAACRARVFGTKAKPTFQLLDFMAVLERVRASR